MFKRCHLRGRRDIEVECKTLDPGMTAGFESHFSDSNVVYKSNILQCMLQFWRKTKNQSSSAMDEILKTHHYFE